jgi:signal transduction histidine kinase/DNA-binding response OmpR family regulator
MKKSTDSARIYERELRLLEKIEEIENQKSLSKDKLSKEYIELGNEYDKLLRQTIKITRIGDANLRKLMRSWKLEQEKLHLEQIVKERTKEIEEKNRQLENQTVLLKEKSEKLKDLSESKSRFFANISHEFRTPLSLIMGLLEEMLSENRDKEEKKKLTLMLRNSQRLLGLINQLLELSKFESGKIKLQACQQQIIPFLKGIVGLFDPVTNKNELDLTFQTEFEEEEETISLYFDAEKLEEIFFNLLSNAVKFTPSGGKITVTASKNPSIETNFPSGSMDISISDTGPGIPRDQLCNVFDRFYQSDRTSEHHRKGTGIGLAIAKELVELHHGEIKACSNKSEGTEFIIRLPMGDAHLEPDEIVEHLEKSYKHKDLKEILDLFLKEKEPGILAGTEMNPLTDANSSKGMMTKRDIEIEPEAYEKNIILIVEDSADVRAYIRRSLEPLYDVADAKGGQEGIQIAQEIIPDLIISDIMMPGIDGYELCRMLKNDRKTSHIPIILLTAKASDENILEGLEVGADDYITKPFNTRILCARIKNLIDLRCQLQQKIQQEMPLQPAKMSVSKIDKEFLKDLQKVIRKNISNPEFNVEKLCRELYMSRATLYRKIQALSGESPTEFIRSYRLKRGAILLKKKFGTVLEVAIEVGFSSANYFTKCFKEKFHRLPSNFKEFE